MYTYTCTYTYTPAAEAAAAVAHLGAHSLKLVKKLELDADGIRKLLQLVLLLHQLLTGVVQGLALLADILVLSRQCVQVGQGAVHLHRRVRGMLPITMHHLKRISLPTCTGVCAACYLSPCIT